MTTPEEIFMKALIFFESIAIILTILNMSLWKNKKVLVVEVVLFVITAISYNYYIVTSKGPTTIFNFMTILFFLQGTIALCDSFVIYVFTNPWKKEQ